MQNRTYLYIIGIMLFIFSVSSNIAWLNPRPDFGVIKMPEKVPFMWQYNLDSPTEILAAAYFPEGFRTNPSRINRPVYPMVVHLFGYAVGAILKPVIDINLVERAVAGYIILKILIYILAGILLFRILKNYCDETAALFAVALTFIHSFSIEYIATFHTTELQFITPIIIIYMFIELGRSYSTKRNILFSIIVGILMLAKPNYATYLAVLAYSILKLRFKDVGISIMSHAIPLTLWLLFLNIYGLEYRSLEAEYGQGVWIYQEFIFLNPMEMVKLIAISFYKYLSLIVAHYTIWIFIFIFTVVFNIRQIDKKVLLFFFMFFAATWFQIFAGLRYTTYMTADISLYIFGVSAWGIFHFLRSVSPHIKQRLVMLILCSWLIFNVMQFVHFPWVHPYDQKSYPAGEFKQKLDKWKIPENTEPTSNK